MCGELAIEAIAREVAGGSSPRVRGTRQAGGERGRDQWFIPACAGNSPRPSARRPAGSVHPRVCGELCITISAVIRVVGSSPRVRGTPLARPVRERGERFIPACAGNSAESAGRRRNRPVHPRVCGELGSTTICCATTAGSSPRVRGTPGAAAPAARPARFIPACAGNSNCVVPICICQAVHPRVCGELPRPWTARRAGCGSSPRVRGTPRQRDPRSPRERFIPACAGNSSRRSAGR